MNLLNRKKIYNPNSKEQVSRRQVFGGQPTAMFDLNKIKYQWAYDLWTIMLANTWFPSEVNMQLDAKDYQTVLTPAEKLGYERALAQLIFMDSLQTNNLIDNVNPFITAPEINLVLVRQAFEEALHSQSYAVMVDSITDHSEVIYDMWRSDARLRAKNDFIASQYMELAQNPTEHNILKSMYANQILEGIYFYSGFAFFYILASQGKMINSATMIKFIQRDEVTHLLLFQKMILSLQADKPRLFTPGLGEQVIEMFRQAAELEISWGEYITQGQIMGLNSALITEYIHYLTDQRLTAVKLPTLYGVKKNPLPRLDSFSDFNAQRSNFFETKVTNYSKGTVDFNDF